MLKGINHNSATRAVATTTDSAPSRRTAGRNFSPVTREQPRPTAAPAGPLAAPTRIGTAARPEPGAVERQLTSAIERKHHIDRMFNRALRGKDASPEELLRLQMQVNEYSLQVDTASRLVERLTSAVKQTMNTQV